MDRYDEADVDRDADETVVESESPALPHVTERIVGNDGVSVLDGFVWPPKRNALGWSLSWCRSQARPISYLMIVCATALVAFREHVSAAQLRRALMEVEARCLGTRLAAGAPPETEAVVDPMGSPTPTESSLAEQVARESRAVELILANDHEGALRQLLDLQRGDPRALHYKDLIVALQWQVRCRQRSARRNRLCN
jgi:hypothetical protein